MSWPAPFKPKVIHLWVDDVPTVLSNQTPFLQLCRQNCINTFTMYNIPTITSQSATLGNFICNAKSNYGICSVAGIINPFDWSPSPPGTRYVQNIISHNQNVSNDPCRRIDYLTLESEFWNINIQYDDSGRPLNPVISGSNCTININANAISGLINTTSPCLNGVSNGMMIRVNVGGTLIVRQITNIAGTTIIFDRPFDNINAVNAPFVIINNLFYYGIDFETFLVRVRDNIRPMAILNNLLPLEMYIARKLTQDQYERLIPHIDRLLIETEYDQLDYPRYNDSAQINTVRKVLSACSVTRVGTISIAPGSNTINGVGTTFRRDLGEKSRIIINGSQIYTINSIVNDTLAYIVGTSPGISAGSTYATYFDYMPMYYISTGQFAYPNRRTWLITPTNSKTLADVYRFHALDPYTIGTQNQSGNNFPESFNAEVDMNIIDSSNLVGVSIYHRSGLETLLGVLPAPQPCPTCSGETTPCEVTAQTYSNCLVVTYTNPSCDCLCNGTMSGFTSYGTPPFTYYVTGFTQSIVLSSSTGYFTGLCADNYSLCVTDSTNLTECYYLQIDLVNTFYAKIISYLNGFCITISGGTLPYNVLLDGEPIQWDDTNGTEITTNCYSAACNTQSVITVFDSSQSTINLCL